MDGCMDERASLLIMSELMRAGKHVKHVHVKH
jgi:hypothetical protein